MASLQNRIIVRMDERVGLTAEEINDALAHSLTWTPGTSPGVEAVVRALESMKGRLVDEVDGTWRLTAAGAAHYDRLEARFDSSGGHGDYGF